MKDGLIVSWVRYHGRSAGLSEALGYETAFIVDRSRIIVWRYFKQTCATWRLVRGSHYRQVIIMLPPFPVLMIVLAATSKKVSIVADLHTGFFLDPKWRWARKLSLRMLQGHKAIVTNIPLAEVCESSGVRAFVLHDILHRPTAPTGEVETPGADRHPTLVCPLGYANDEPIAELIDAIRRMPEFRFILTGRPPQWVRSAVSSNVEFSGYLSNDEYWRLIDVSDGVVALTTRDLTMQRAGYEALLCGKPQVTANFEVLRSFYEDAAVYTDPDSDSIVAAVRAMVQQIPRLRERCAVVLEERRAEQRRALQVLAGDCPPTAVGGANLARLHGGRGA